MKELNVKVFGAGPSGSLLAIALAHFNTKVYLFDILDMNTLLSRDRSYAITHSTRKLLQKLEIWSELENKIIPFYELSVLDSVINKSIVCPRSGWSIKSVAAKINNNPGIKLYLLFCSSFDLAKNQADKIIKHGFKNSEGWIVIIPKTDIHLDAPPLDKPIISVNKTPNKLNINRIKDIFRVNSFGNIDIVIIKATEINKKTDCLIKK